MNKENEKLTIIDIMKELQCTRYTVMKYYTCEELPLKKQGNKYYINRNELEKWIEKMNKRKRIQSIIIFILALLAIVFLIYIFYNN